MAGPFSSSLPAFMPAWPCPLPRRQLSIKTGDHCSVKASRRPVWWQLPPGPHHIPPGRRQCHLLVARRIAADKPGLTPRHLEKGGAFPTFPAGPRAAVQACVTLSTCGKSVVCKLFLPRCIRTFFEAYCNREKCVKHLLPICQQLPVVVVKTDLPGSS